MFTYLSKENCFMNFFSQQRKNFSLLFIFRLTHISLNIFFIELQNLILDIS
jgi:hypothetical protein